MLLNMPTSTPTGPGLAGRPAPAGALALASGIDPAGGHEVLDLVELTPGRRPQGWKLFLGMGKPLGLAAALLVGDLSTADPESN